MAYRHKSYYKFGTYEEYLEDKRRREKLRHRAELRVKLIAGSIVALFIGMIVAGIFNDPGPRVGAICRDGWVSGSTSRGTCSHHGGVSRWVYEKDRE